MFKLLRLKIKMLLKIRAVPLKKSGNFLKIVSMKYRKVSLATGKMLDSNLGPQSQSSGEPPYLKN